MFNWSYLSWAHFGEKRNRRVKSQIQNSYLSGNFIPAAYLRGASLYSTLMRWRENKAGNTATPVACGWAGAIFEVTSSFGQEQ